MKATTRYICPICKKEVKYDGWEDYIKVFGEDILLYHYGCFVCGREDSFNMAKQESPEHINQSNKE